MTSRIAKTIRDKKNGYMDKMINGYLDFVKREHITELKRAGNLSRMAFALEGEAYSQNVFNSLVNTGYITKGGSVTDKFDPFDPELDLGLTANKQENERIVAKLREVALGGFNLDNYDYTKIGGQNRKIIKVIDPNGKRSTLNEVIDRIGQGHTLAEKYSNTRDAYNVFFDIYESMTQTHIAKSGNGKLAVTYTGDGYEVKIYPKGEWQQWNTALNPTDVEGEALGGWEKIEDQPITVKFNSVADAENFLGQVKSVIALLEPVLGTFDPVYEGGPGQKSLTYEAGNKSESKLRVLIDNEGELINGRLVEYNKADYEVQVDYVYHQTYFQTQHWQNVADYVGKKAIREIGSKIGRAHV